MKINLKKKKRIYLVHSPLKPLRSGIYFARKFLVVTQFLQYIPDYSDFSFSSSVSLASLYYFRNLSPLNFQFYWQKIVYDVLLLLFKMSKMSFPSTKLVICAFAFVWSFSAGIYHFNYISLFMEPTFGFVDFLHSVFISFISIFSSYSLWF